MNEKRLAMIATSATGASIMFAILGLFVLFGVVSIAAGEYDLLASGFIWCAVAWFITYVMSIYVLATLPGRSRRRRLVSWGFSSAFHAATILYFVLALDLGTDALIFLAPETAIALVSVAGLGTAVRANT